MSAERSSDVKFEIGHVLFIDNMPAFGSSLKPPEIDALVAFLQSRKRPIRPQDQSPMAQN
jgi:hypothetical protein